MSIQVTFDCPDMQAPVVFEDATPVPVPGPRGKSAYEVACDNGYEGTEAEWLASLQGKPGDPGQPGNPGNNGLSAYQIAQKNGYEGTEAEWLASLQGKPGDPGKGGVSATHSWSGTTLTVTSASGTSSANLKGEKGDPGATPVKGTDYFTEADKQQFKDDLGQLASGNEAPALGTELAAASGWTTTGWTGDFASGFTHTSGNTNALSFAIPGIAVGKSYVIEFDCSVAYTNTNLLVTIGSAPEMLLYGVNSQNTRVGVKAVDTGALKFTPESAFVGKISNISVREITETSTPSQTIKGSDGTVVSETRNIGENLFVGVGVGGKTVPPGLPGMTNVAIGNSETFQDNISGFWNVAIGTDCMNGNVSGSRNVSIGANNLRNNVEGCRNVAIGNFAMAQTKSAHGNVAIGGDCMSTATGGKENTAIGFQSLYANTTGYNNVSVGSNTLLKNTTGLGNVALGYSALSKVTSGRNNIAIGYAAGDTIATGNGNIIIGANADAGSASYYALNIGDLLKGSVQSGAAYLLINGGLRLPSIGTAQTANNDVYAEEWTFTLEDGSTVTKKVLLV